MPEDLSKKSKAELFAMLYDPEAAVEESAKMVGMDRMPNPAGVPPDVSKIGPLENPKVKEFIQKFSRFSRDADMGDLATNASEKQLKDAAVDASVGAAGNLVGEGMMAPALSSGSRFLNTLMGAVKGAGLNEGMTRGATALKGDPQPSATDPSQLFGDSVGALFGGLQGRGPSIPAPEDPRLLWEARKKFLSADIKKNSAMTPRVKRAAEAARRVYDSHQSAMSAEAKALGMDSFEDLTDQIVKHKGEMEQLRARYNAGFKPDPNAEAELKEGIKKYRTQVQQSDIVRVKDEKTGRFLSRNDAKRVAQERLQQHEKALQDLQEGSTQEEHGHIQKMLEKAQTIREMEVAGRRARTGAFDKIPTNKDIADGKKAIDLRKSMEESEKALEEHLRGVEDLKVTSAEHGKVEPPQSPEAEKTWEKLLKMGRRGGISGVAAYQFLHHLGLPADVAGELGFAIGTAANSPQAAAAARFMQNKIGPGATRALPIIASTPK